MENTLWVVVHDIFSIVTIGLYDMCQCCTNSLNILKLARPTGDRRVELCLKRIEDIQLTIGDQSAITVVPPIPASVAVIETFASHELLLSEISGQCVPVTSDKNFSKVQSAYNYFFHKLTELACYAVDFWVEGKPFESLKDCSDSSVEIFVEKRMLNSLLNKWNDTMQNFLSLVLCPPTPDVRVPEKCISESQNCTGEKYERIVVLGSTKFSRALQILSRNMNVVFIEENVSFDDDGIKYIKELQCNHPDKTLWVILSGVSEVAEVVDEGYPECKKFLCSPSLPAFVYKNHSLGDPDYKNTSSKGVVVDVVKKVIDFVDKLSDELCLDSDIIIAPITPLNAVWGGDGSSHGSGQSSFCHDKIHKIYQGNPNIPVLYGDIDTWIQITKDFEVEWHDFIMTNLFEYDYLCNLLEIYFEEKPQVLNFAEEDTLKEVDKALDIWSTLMADMFRFFLVDKSIYNSLSPKKGSRIEEKPVSQNQIYLGKEGKLINQNQACPNKEAKPVNQNEAYPGKGVQLVNQNQACPEKEAWSVHKNQACPGKDAQKKAGRREMNLGQGQAEPVCQNQDYMDKTLSPNETKITCPVKGPTDTEKLSAAHLTNSNMSDQSGLMQENVRFPFQSVPSDGNSTLSVQGIAQSSLLPHTSLSSYSQNENSSYARTSPQLQLNPPSQVVPPPWQQSLTHKSNLSQPPPQQPNQWQQSLSYWPHSCQAPPQQHGPWQQPVPPHEFNPCQPPPQPHGPWQQPVPPHELNPCQPPPQQLYQRQCQPSLQQLNPWVQSPPPHEFSPCQPSQQLNPWPQPPLPSCESYPCQPPPPQPRPWKQSPLPFESSPSQPPFQQPWQQPFIHESNPCQPSPPQRNSIQQYSHQASSAQPNLHHPSHQLSQYNLPTPPSLLSPAEQAHLSPPSHHLPSEGMSSQLFCQTSFSSSSISNVCLQTRNVKETKHKPEHTKQGAKIIIGDVVSSMTSDDAEHFLKSFGDLDDDGMQFLQDRQKQYSAVIIAKYKRRKDAEEAEKVLNIIKTFGPKSRAKFFTDDNAAQNESRMEGTTYSAGKSYSKNSQVKESNNSLAKELREELPATVAPEPSFRSSGEMETSTSSTTIRKPISFRIGKENTDSSSKRQEEEKYRNQVYHFLKDAEIDSSPSESILEDTTSFAGKSCSKNSQVKESNNSLAKEMRKKLLSIVAPELSFRSSREKEINKSPVTTISKEPVTTIAKEPHTTVGEEISYRFRKENTDPTAKKEDKYRKQVYHFLKAVQIDPSPSESKMEEITSSATKSWSKYSQEKEPHNSLAEEIRKELLTTVAPELSFRSSRENEISTSPMKTKAKERHANIGEEISDIPSKENADSLAKRQEEEKYRRQVYNFLKDSSLSKSRKEETASSVKKPYSDSSRDRESIVQIAQIDSSPSTSRKEETASSVKKPFFESSRDRESNNFLTEAVRKESLTTVTIEPSFRLSREKETSKSPVRKITKEPHATIGEEISYRFSIEKNIPSAERLEERFITSKERTDLSAKRKEEEKHWKESTRESSYSCKNDRHSKEKTNSSDKRKKDKKCCNKSRRESSHSSKHHESRKKADLSAERKEENYQKKSRRESSDSSKQHESRKKADLSAERKEENYGKKSTRESSHSSKEHESRKKADLSAERIEENYQKKSTRESSHSSKHQVREKTENIEETKYLLAKEGLQLEYDLDLQLFIQMPEIHSDYKSKFEFFREHYHRKFPGEIDEEHYDSLWKEFWKENMTERLKEEYEEKIRVLDLQHQENQVKSSEKLPILESSVDRKILERKIHGDESDVICIKHTVETPVIKDLEKEKHGSDSDVEIIEDTKQTVTKPITFEDNNDVFLEETLRLLSEVTPFLGMYGPPFEELKDEIRDCLPDRAKLYKLFEAEEKRLVLRMISQKARDLSEVVKVSGSEKHVVKLQLASVGAHKLLCYALSASESQSFYGLDIESVAKATYGKSHTYVIQSIKDLLSFKDIKGVPDNDIERIYGAVVRSHMVTSYKNSESHLSPDIAEVLGRQDNERKGQSIANKIKKEREEHVNNERKGQSIANTIKREREEDVDLSSKHICQEIHSEGSKKQKRKGGQSIKQEPQRMEVPIDELW